VSRDGRLRYVFFTLNFELLTFHFALCTLPCCASLRDLCALCERSGSSLSFVAVIGKLKNEDVDSFSERDIIIVDETTGKDSLLD
jgi:hypothetical protein